MYATISARMVLRSFGSQLTCFPRPPIPPKPKKKVSGNTLKVADLVLGSCRAGTAWKTAKSRKWKRNGNRNGKRPQAGKGARRCEKNGFLREFSIIFPFLGHFCPFPAWGCFPFRFPFFCPFPAFGRFQCRTSPAGSQKVLVCVKPVPETCEGQTVPKSPKPRKNFIKVVQKLPNVS